MTSTDIYGSVTFEKQIVVLAKTFCGKFTHSYDGSVSAVRACEEHPAAKVSVWLA